MLAITVNHSEKEQVVLKTKQNPALSLFIKGISERLGQRSKVKSKKKIIKGIPGKQNKVNKRNLGLAY